MAQRSSYGLGSKEERIVKLGDLVKVKKSGLRQLEYASRLPGIIVELTKNKYNRPEIVYVSWPDRIKPLPMNVRWLEVFDG